MANHWEHFDHGADIGVRGFGANMATAFEQAALALTAVIADPSRVNARDAIDIVCEAPDHDLLLVHWLNAIVSQMALRHMLFSRFDVQIDGHRLKAHVWGEPLSVQKHLPAVEVKGATCTALRVAPTARGNWMAQTVVDV